MILACLVLSVLLNMFLVWYMYTLLKKLLFVSDNIGGFLEGLESFSEHLESVYSMETYYGDATLERLLEHSRELVKEIGAYEEIYELTQDDTDDTDDIDDIDEAEEQEGLDG